MAGLFNEAGGQADTTYSPKKQGQTDKDPNLERADINTQTKPGTEGKLGEGHSQAP